MRVKYVSMMDKTRIGVVVYLAFKRCADTTRCARCAATEHWKHYWNLLLARDSFLGG